MKNHEKDVRQSTEEGGVLVVEGIEAGDLGVEKIRDGGRDEGVVGIERLAKRGRGETVPVMGLG